MEMCWNNFWEKNHKNGSINPWKAKWKAYVLLSYSQYNKLTQTQWLKATQICYLTVPEVGWKSFCRDLPTEEEIHFLAISGFSGPLVLLGSWLLLQASEATVFIVNISVALLSLSLLLSSSRLRLLVCLPASCSLAKIPGVTLGLLHHSRYASGLKILSLIMSLKSFLSCKVTYSNITETKSRIS